MIPLNSHAPTGSSAKLPLAMLFAVVWGMLTQPCATAAQDSSGVALPPGVKAVWDPAKAFKETTPTRERLCINGLWRWQPAADNAVEVPTAAWGYYKVPACWPGVQDYLQGDYQTLYPDPSWKNTKLSEVQSAWYERTITIPEEWAGRRVALDVGYLNSYAAVYVDGRKVGEIRFPAGQVDLSAAVRPGATHVLSLLVVAMPLKAVMESYNDTNTARQRKGKVERRGLCGDVWLIGEPAGARLSDIRVDTSVRRSQITFEAGLQGLVAGARYKLRARITDQGTQVAEFTGPTFLASEVKDSRATFAASWKPPKLWDINTPQNQYAAELSLLDAGGKVVDAATPVRFGFREFWIQGRDFYLNGTRLYLSLVPMDNASVGAALATYAAAKESLLRLKSFGINFVYTHNYGCEPGSHLSFAEILRAADDTGMLVALSQPHFSAYDWKTPDADQTNGYAHHAEFYVGVAGSHPSVVCYSMSHNATGYNEDTDPVMMDGKSNPRDQWADRNVRLALRCEAIVKRLDPARIVYHHSSGDLSAMYTLNFYLNFVPIQELDDWFEHWSNAGDKPMVLVEYGVPFGWDWAMYRGWYNGQREFGSATCRGSIVSPNGTLSSSATRLTRSATGKKPTCAGRRSSSAQGAPGTGGITPTRWAMRGWTRCSRCKRPTQPTTGGRSALGAFRPTRPGSTTASGNCATGSNTAARIYPWTGTTCSSRATARISLTGHTPASIWLTSGPTGSPRPPPSRCSAITCRCWPGSRASRSISPPRTTPFTQAKPSRSNSS